ncbi:28419_t:CDS:2, partial [Racocetra persica]
EFSTRELKERVEKLYIKNDQGVDSDNGQNYYFYKTQLEGELDLNEFVNLKYLEIKGSDFGIGTYQKLTNIDLTSCEKIKELYLCRNDGNLVIEGNNTLSVIKLERCENLVNFPVSELLSKLETLDISLCPKLKTIPNLKKLRNLKTLIFYDCPNLTELEGLNELSKLAKFSINENRHPYSARDCKLTNLDLSKMDNLSRLFLGYCPQLENLILTDCRQLDNASLSDCSQLSKLEGLEGLKSLKSLAFTNCPQLPQPSFELMDSLQSLNIANCPKFACQSESLPPKIVNLRFASQQFSNYNLEKLVAKESVGELNDLTSLVIESCSNLEKIEGLEKLVKLAEQKIQGLETEVETEKKENQEMKQQLSESENQVARLEKDKAKAEDDARQESAEKIKEIEELRKKQLTENEKRILEKLEELFSIFDNRTEIADKDIENLEKVLKEYRNLDFTNTPNLPDNFKSENEGVANIQQKEEEIKGRMKEIDTLKSRVESLNSRYEHERQFVEQELKKITGLQEKIDALKSESGQQKTLLQKQLDEVQKEVKQSQEKLDAEQTKAEFLQNKLEELNQEKSVLQDDLIKRDKEITELKKKIEMLDFLTKEKFKKGEIYELSTPGSFIQDSSEIIQGTDQGGHELERASDAKQELIELKRKFDDLQLKKRQAEEKISSLEESIQNKEEENQKLNQELHNSRDETGQLQSRVTNLEYERDKIKSDLKTEIDEIKIKWASPKERKKLTQEKEKLSNELKTERREKQNLIESLEDLPNEKLNDAQKVSFNTLLAMQRQLDVLVFKGVDQQLCSVIKDQLLDAKVKLGEKLDAEEIGEICEMQTEIVKLENSQTQ